jgi:signal transduction histidine kinase
VTADAAARLPGCLRHFPGAVLRVAGDGTVVDSNGRLEAVLGRALVGHPFAGALDADSCGDKWARILGDAAGAARAGGTVEELVLRGDETLAEPRAFSVLRDPGEPGLWLVEHPRDPRLEQLRAMAGEVNSELVNTQRELLKERGRLARALAQLEARQAELERSNRALDEFAHAVSHDLKAPLRSIANYAAWVAEDAGGALGPDAAAHLERLQAQVGRMRALIDGILAYARAGRERWEPEAVDVGALVRDVVATLGPPPGVRVTVDEGLPTLWAERAPLRQVLQNLVGNAVAHARPDDPRVHVSGRPAGGQGAQYEFAVTDNGPGVAPELRERIWELFHSLAPAGGAAGTGIGLALVRRLVEGHGGTAWVESAEGEGATFRFRWPTSVQGRV